LTGLQSAAGQFADIVAMPDNPLQDVESLRKINFVMKNGKVVRSRNKSSEICAT
jgi:imidazolonepropionase-like amidohydrolase